MLCLICRQGELLVGLTAATFERGEVKLAINNVPAYICPSCGEAILDEEVAVQLLRLAEEMSEAGMIENVRDFQSL